MEELKKVVLKLLRQGNSVQHIRIYLSNIEKELDSTQDYLQAIKEADFAP
jgi:hypothetical protein